MRLVNRTAAGAKPVSRTVPAATIGIIALVSKKLRGTSSFSLLAGSNANLSINSSTGAISATAGITAGQSQTARVREAVASDNLALEYPVVLTAVAAGGGTPTPTPTAPTFSEPPTISGIPQDGETIAFTSALWTDYDTIEGRVINSADSAEIVGWTILSNLSDLTLSGVSGKTLVYQERATKNGVTSVVASSEPFGPVISVVVSWSPDTKASEITLTNGNLTAGFTGTAAYRSVLGTTSKSADGDYWVTFSLKDTFPGDCQFGVGNGSAALNNYLGANFDSLGVSNSGQIYRGGVVGNTGALSNNGTVRYGMRLTIVDGVRTLRFYSGATLLATVTNSGIPTGPLFFIGSLSRNPNEIVLGFEDPPEGVTPWNA